MLGVLLFGLSFNLLLEVGRPGKRDQQPHEQRSCHGKAGMIEKPYGNKAEDQRVRSAPEPEILVQAVENDDRDDQQGSFHYRLSGRANNLCLTDPVTGLSGHQRVEC